jgi:acetoin utilization deacetylase AcuC-like enzyme
VVGTGRGVGFNVNVAWEKEGMGDAEYLLSFQRVLLPIATQFKPQLILISAGACIPMPCCERKTA